ncbi:MAG: SUF system Fe-S cluster assembly regulator [Alphaproteobacteria bacterium]|nr:SUF system Fe-S cluster assembly regulator [Alphaproteobacteria bacterium]
MLRLSRLTDYAVTLLSHMGSEKGVDLWAAPTLAELSGLSLHTVAKILKLLAKAKLVSAQRGATGGYRLCVPPSQISVTAIIEALDGPISITDCSSHNERQNCKIQHLCPLCAGWNKANIAVREALSRVMLADLMDPSPFLVSFSKKHGTASS